MKLTSFAIAVLAGVSKATQVPNIDTSAPLSTEQIKRCVSLLDFADRNILTKVGQCYDKTHLALLETECTVDPVPAGDFKFAAYIGGKRDSFMDKFYTEIWVDFYLYATGDQKFPENSEIFFYNQFAAHASDDQFASHAVVEGKSFETVSCQLEWDPSKFTATSGSSQASDVSVLQFLGQDSFKDEDLKCAPLGEVNKDSRVDPALNQWKNDIAAVPAGFEQVDKDGLQSARCRVYYKWKSIGKNEGYELFFGKATEMIQGYKIRANADATESLFALDNPKTNTWLVGPTRLAEDIARREEQAQQDANPPEPEPTPSPTPSPSPSPSPSGGSDKPKSGATALTGGALATIAATIAATLAF